MSRRAWTVAIVMVVVVASGCESRETTRIGACQIRPGTLCNGNYMRNVKLVGAGLFTAQFERADLSGADLSDADLSGANLRRASLDRARLVDANLQYADLSGADLRGARLRGADLTGADLTGAKLRGGELADARVCRTVLPDGSTGAPDC